MLQKFFVMIILTLTHTQGFGIEISVKNTTRGLIADHALFEYLGNQPIRHFHKIDNRDYWTFGWTEIQKSGPMPDVIVIGKRYPAERSNPQQIDPICIIRKVDLDVETHKLLKMHIYIKWAAKNIVAYGTNYETNIYYCEIRRLFPHDDGSQKWYSDSHLLKFGPLYYWIDAHSSGGGHYTRNGDRHEFLAKYRTEDMTRWNKEFHNVFRLER